MPSCCICYTSDQCYLLPTLVSAMQARSHASPDRADVAIFAFQTDPDTRRAFGDVCEAEGIMFRAVGDDVIENANAMLARLFLNRFVPPDYSRYLYMDSDVQITGSLSALLDFALPGGRFMAASDPITFFLPEATGESRSLREYFSSVGLGAGLADAYFNTGVLLIDRQGWEEVGPRAWQLFRQHGQRFRFPDQDVLNLAAEGRRLPMSLVWNFPIFMRNSRVEHEIKPRVYHFMSKPKPWQGTYPPWDASAAMPYSAILARHPSLARFTSAMPRRFHLRYHLQQRFKKVKETVEWGLSARRRGRILAYERACRAAMAAADPATADAPAAA